jgi:hypothetical protein
MSKVQILSATQIVLGSATEQIDGARDVQGGQRFV